MKEEFVDTTHCRIAVARSGGNGPAILMIHGNSSCKEVFRNQLEGRVGSMFRCVAMDLPGHGRSADALDPFATYSMPGYADAALQTMRALGFETYAVLGWSLGGHIGLEMTQRSGDVVGLMISGTPPMGRGEAGMRQAFVASRHMTLAGQRHFSDEEIDAYSRATCGVNAPFEGFLRDAVARTDGRAREISSSLFRREVGCNQREAAEKSAVPLAIVNGADDEFINHDYIASLDYRNLWEGEVHALPGIGHAPFWEAPEQFDPLLIRFVESVLA